MTGDPARRGDRQALVLVLTAACGLAGGLLAVGLLTERYEAASVWVPLLIVSGVAVVATAVAFLVLTARPAPAHRPPAAPPAPQRPHAAPRTAPPPSRPWYDATANQSPRPAQRPPAAPEPQVAPGHVVLPLEAGNDAGGQWWNKSAPAAAAGHDSPPAPDLPSHVADGTALVAQCPNCGDFRIDVHRADPGYAFRCRNPQCGEEWRWTPGTPWPSVVVRRNLTGRERGR
ncbi:MAG TPA: hypothetical protein VGP26_33085 [Actinophytocola sp.]|jgi:hypothetical protein|nr:hypothetical protein [Actinophytocola sp.]